MEPTDLAALTDDPVAFFGDPDAAVRRLAVAAVAARIPGIDAVSSLSLLLARDPSPRVRAEAAEALAEYGRRALGLLMEAADDPDPTVAEAIATGLGTVGSPDAVPLLMEWARAAADGLVREAAVAALGAIGDERAAPLLLDLVASGPPQVRRRCVVALTVFDGAAIEAALSGALEDRNPMVREAAEMVLGRPMPDRGHDGRARRDFGP